MNESFLGFCYLFFKDSISFWSPAGLEYLIFLLQYPESWDYICTSHPVIKITIKKYFHNFDMTV